MEIVLNFDKKEMVIKEKSNLKELYTRLEKLLGKDLKNWEVVSDVVYQNSNWWYYQPYQTFPWYDDTIRPGTITCGTTEDGISVYCLSDSTSATFELSGSVEG